jgi:hypothetical protein
MMAWKGVTWRKNNKKFKRSWIKVPSVRGGGGGGGGGGDFACCLEEEEEEEILANY